MEAHASESELPQIAQPAIRALARVGITRLDQLPGRSKAELRALHGVGPSAIRRIEEALAVNGNSLAP